MLTRKKTGDTIAVLDQELRILGEWSLSGGRETELLAIDSIYVYIAQKDWPKEQDEVTASQVYRLTYLKPEATIEEIFVQ